MILPTASAFPRLVKCPASHVLPQTRQPSSNAAKAGQKRHADIADVLTGRAPPDSIPWPVHDILGIQPGDTVAVERSWRLDLATGEVRWLGDELNRGYPAPETDTIDGTADAVVDHADGPRILVDWKGRGGADPVRSNWQLRALALAASADIVAIVALDGDEYAAPDATEFSASDHAYTLEVLRTTAELVQALADRHALAPLGLEHVTPGDHCRYCDAKPSCPAYATVARDLDTATTVGVIDRARTELATPEGVGQWYEWVKRARSVVETIDLAIRARLADGPGVLPDGREIGLSTVTPRKLEARVTLRVLRERYGDDADGAASVSIAAAERIAKGHAPKGQGAAEVRALTAALEEANAIGDDAPRTTVVVRDAKRGGDQ